MRTVLFSILSGVLFGSGLLAVQEHPPREGQPEFCTVEHREEFYRCKCLDHDHGEGCSVQDDGTRRRGLEAGMAGICKSHCRIRHCHCCQS